MYANIFCAICNQDLNLTISKAILKCNNEDLLTNCGISPLRDILRPEYYSKNKRLQWTRYLGLNRNFRPNDLFGYDRLNNCSESQGYSLTCHLNLQMASLPRARYAFRSQSNPTQLANVSQVSTGRKRSYSFTIPDNNSH